MINRINAQRAAHGLMPLRENVQLGHAAAKHAADLASAPWLIDTGRWHEGSNGSTIRDRIVAEGYTPTSWGEITGWGFGDGDPNTTAGEFDRMMAWWMNSPVHRDTILSPGYEDIGYGYLYAPGAPWGHYYVVNFGKRKDAPQPPAPTYTSHVPVVLAGAGAPEFDLLSYLKGDGRAYMVQHPSGAQEKFRTVERPAHRWLQLKNSQWEEFWYSDEYIFRGRDTSPGEGQYYRQFEDGNEGARWAPRRMTVGQSWTSPVQHTVQTYDKATCRPVDHHRNGRAINSLRLQARHERMTWNGITVEDVIELITHTGERMYFARGYGLVAWASAWGSSAISELLPPEAADNEPEQGCFS